MSPHMTRALLLSTALLFTACGDKEVVTSEPAPVVQEDGTPVFDAATLPHAQLPGTVVPRGYRIDMRIDPDQDSFTGEVAIDVDVLDPISNFFIHAKDMEITKATLASGADVIDLRADNVPLDLAPSGLARLSADDTLPRGDGTLRLSYTTPFNTSLNSAYKVTRKTDDGEDNYIVTQMEPVGAREAFPGFDEPKFKVPFTLTITSPADDIVYANTPKTTTREVEEDWIKHEFETTRPLPTYLVAFGVGPYDVVDGGMIPTNSVRKRPIAQRGFTAKGSGEEITYGLAGTEPILRALEEYFGSEYPYEKLDLIAAPDYAFGAMENPGAIVYREYLMLLNEDSPLNQKRAYNGVHSHELAHQWFGNLVTPVWWEDIWLNEAFATWMGNKGTAMAYPDGNYDRNTLNAALYTMNTDSLASTRSVREPLERTENVMDQFDGITYRKGGGVLSMFESFVGEEAFRDGVRLHMERYKDDVASADDFFQSIADGSKNPDVVPAMKSFVDQPGVPLVTAELTCDAEANNGVAKLKQTRYAPLGSTIQQGQSWQIPVCIAFGSEGERNKECTLMNEGSGELELGTCADWATLNADGAGYYRFTLDSTSWQNLFDNIDELNTKEVLTVQDSLTAAFRAGEVEPTIYIAGMETFAKHTEYDVASKAGDLLGFMHGELPDAREDLGELITDMYAERYAANVGKDTIEGELLVPTLAANLTRRAGNTELAADFAAKGKAYLAGDKAAVAPNLLSRALREYAIVTPEAARNALLTMVENGTSLEKGVAVGALGSIDDQGIAVELRTLAMNTDGPFTGRQALSLISTQMGVEPIEDDTWTWVQDNFVTLVARVPDVRKPRLPGLASGFCSEGEALAVEAFFADNAALIPGYERSLNQSLESIALCTEFNRQMGDKIEIALAARGE